MTLDTGVLITKFKIQHPNFQIYQSCFNPKVELQLNFFQKKIPVNKKKATFAAPTGWYHSSVGRAKD